MVEWSDQDRAPWASEPIALTPVLPRDDSSRESLVALYRDAFSAAPYSRSETQVDGFREALRAHVNRPGFTGFQARTGSHVVAFAYGYTTHPHHRWHQDVREALGTRADAWLSNCFALAELAVHPDFQGLGIGRALHDELLAAQTHPRAVLSTLDAPTPARVLYASAGWRLLAENVRFPLSTERYVILGRRIPRP